MQTAACAEQLHWQWEGNYYNHAAALDNLAELSGLRSLTDEHTDPVLASTSLHELGDAHLQQQMWQQLVQERWGQRGGDGDDNSAEEQDAAAGYRCPNRNRYRNRPNPNPYPNRSNPTDLSLTLIDLTLALTLTKAAAGCRWELYPACLAACLRRLVA